MSNEVPKVISTYLEITAAHDVAGCAACFTHDAVVHDEGSDHRGIEAVRGWIGAVAEQYQLTFTVLGFDGWDHGAVTRVEVADNFAGSPVVLHQHYSLAGDRIRALTICP